MEKEVAVDQAIYLVNYETESYRFLRRNPDWEKLTKEENQRNKESIKGFTRTFRDGRTKVFR